MARRIPLAHRLLLSWFIATALVLLIAGSAFVWQQSQQAEADRRNRIESAFAVLRNQLSSQAAELAATNRSLAEHRSVIATSRLFAHYFDPAADNATTFDPPAEELSREIAHVARASQADWVVVMTGHGPLAGFGNFGDQEEVTYWSQRAGARVAMTARGSPGASTFFEPAAQAPNYVAAAATPGLRQSFLDRCHLGKGAALVSESPIVETEADGQSREVGRLVLGRCLDQDFVSQMAARSEVGFAILGMGELRSDNMPTLTGLLAEAGPIADSELTLGTPREAYLNGYQAGIAELATRSGDAIRFVFALDASQGLGQPLTLATSGIAAMGFAMLLMLAAGFSYFRRTLTRPLEKLMVGVHGVLQGKYHPVTDVAGDDELGELVRAFNNMSEGIRFREDELRKLSRAVEQSPTAVMITDPAGAIEYVNPGFAATTGYSAAEAMGRNPSFLKGGETPTEVYRELWRTIKSGETWRGDLHNRTKDGRLIWEHVSISPICDDNGATTHFVAVREDITQRKEAESRIQHLAYHDSLTDLPNRRLFHDRLEQLYNQFLRHGHAFALLLMDLDHFKDVNDSAGHGVGDELLRQVGQRVAATIRDTDTLSRLGGDEFAILQVGIESPIDAVILAEKVLACFHTPFIIGDRMLFSRTSVGILIASPGAVAAQELVRRADIALYKAKERGRGGYVFYDDSMTTQVMADTQLIRDLSEAIAKEQLYLVYQPQINLASGTLAGVEALLRWRHPTLGEIPPLRFIALAESRGLIAEITQWVLEEASRQLRDWHGRGFPVPSMAVNISAAQLNNSRDFELLRNALDNCVLPHGALELEFTESAFLNLDENIWNWIVQLKQQGIRTAIDDFGTGYSSMALLRQLRADTLKIDQQFVRDMLSDANDAAIVKATVALAKALGLAIVAEGIETSDQAAFLEALGCDLGQGYHFSRPVLPAALEAAFAAEFQSR